MDFYERRVYNINVKNQDESEDDALKSLKNRKKDYALYSSVRYDDIRDMLDVAADKFGDKTAISYRNSPKDAESEKVSFDEMRKTVAAIATELIAAGLRGKKVGIIGENSIGWIYSYFAVTSMGAIAVPIDKEYPAPDMASILNTARCDALLFSPSLKDKFDYIIKEVPTLKFYASFTAKQNDEYIPTLAELMAAGEEKIAGGDNSYYNYEIDPDAMVSIVFTSGTTGKGKGVMLSTRNILDDMSNGIFLFNMPEKTLFALPAHHTFGSTVNLIGHYMQGLEIYISSGNRYILEELKKEDPTHLVLVPLYIETFYKKIFASIEKQGKLPLVKRTMKISDGLRKCGIDLREKLFAEILKNFGSRMRLIVSGGAALNPDIIRDFESIGIVILNGYGITECAPLISCNRNNYRKAGSVGRPIIYEDVKIYNPDANGEGEICVKGTNVMLGYYENDEATREVFDEEGYFHTGDLGKIDDEGWIYITGRSKNLIILSNGKNVYPEEIETELSRIYGLSEVIVYEGLSRDGAATDLIVAEIFPDREALALRSITDEKKYFDTEVAALNARSAPHKKIGLVKIREVEFEKTTTRKITRFSIDKTVD